MEGRRNRGGLDLLLDLIQLDGPDFWGGDRFAPRNVNGEEEESGKNGKSDLGKDASIKEDDTKDEIDELPDQASLNGAVDDRSWVFGIGTDRSSGFGSALT